MPCRSPRTSNPKAALPIHTLYEIPAIISADESADLVKVIDEQHHREWLPEGYDRRHRVQRYSSVGSSDGGGADGNGPEGARDWTSMEEAFGWIVDRIVAFHPEPAGDANGRPSAAQLHRPSEAVVIEHTPRSCRSVVHTFEQNTLCQCRRLQEEQRSQKQNSNDGDSSCNCYVAQLTLVNSAIQHIEKPLRRELECWDLAPPVEDHETQVVMERNGVVVKMGETLWDWRGRILGIRKKNNAGEHNSDEVSRETENSDRRKTEPRKRTNKPGASEQRCITVSFRGIQQPRVNTHTEEMTACFPQAKNPSSLSKLLTIVVTTSPIRSHPSTEMLEHTFDTFHFGGDEFAFECPKVVVCDGCRVQDGGDDRLEEEDGTRPTRRLPKITRKHSNLKQTLRNGIVTVDQARDYAEFKSRLRGLCEGANDAPTSRRKSPFRNTKVVELGERHGYGFALRHVLRHWVATPYICVIQHDRTFMRPTPIKEAVAAMEGDPGRRIKYVGMSMRSNLMYHDIFSGKYGRRAADEFKNMILRPRELCIGDNLYGADGRSVENMVAPKSEKRHRILEALKTTYRGSHQYMTYKEQSRGAAGQREGFHQLSLTPTLFWYDNTHIAQTAHYRDFVFHPPYRMVARGGFVEDKLSPCIVRSCERLGLKDGHAKFGCYLLDDHSGAFFTGHLDGGSYMTADLHRSPKGDTYATKIQENSRKSH